MREIKDRPQIRQPVFYRRAGQRDARGGVDFFHLSGLFGSGVFDGLRLVDNGHAPFDIFQHR